MDEHTFYSLRDISRKLYTINVFISKNYAKFPLQRRKAILKKAKKESLKARKIFERCRLYYPGKEAPITVNKKTLASLENLSYHEILDYKKQVEIEIAKELSKNVVGKKLPSRITCLLTKLFQKPTVDSPVMSNV
ncbi:hypothetical protein NBT05_14180 [Aquimarina sp. ERC-38]|uniref:hypothetical protein n=1 Tax=Aquimarina sp. ERC-38 TaxID=2949996 RepID=UPI002247C195|nr:hypothetical protein [Aquimarina sp. ERC-38]UZO80090.1 hypothetical protein NBT05_14180 [Aquimarina sp. ERC-38]